MPNTLAHLGVGGLVTRAVAPDADLKWIYAGCIIPDVPWIARRVVLRLPVDFDLYELHLYATAQSTLAGCLVLSAALASVSRSFHRVFGILAINSLLHLVLDACQTKWANGVHLFAPFSWEMWNARLFWPESPVTYVLTGWGVVFFAWHLWSDKRDGIGCAFTARGVASCGGFLAAYLLLPLLLLEGPARADNHFVATLEQTSQRPGKYVEFDRDVCRRSNDVCLLETFAGEDIELRGVAAPTPGRYSVRGEFVDSRTVQVYELHAHPRGLRDFASLLGLILVVGYWLASSHRVGRGVIVPQPSPRESW